MMKNCLYAIFAFAALSAKAQGGYAIPKEDKLYWGNSIDGFIFSTSIFSTPAHSSKLTTLRFSKFFHIGINLNYDINTRVGVYTGIGVKNIGFIEKKKAVDSTIKRRVYTIGVPVGLKIGDQIHRRFVFAGGGVDVPFNYKEKRFIRRGNKSKFNEWLSDRTPMFMPYVFAGVSVEPGITFKLQYYPANFFNTDFTDAAGIQPYTGYSANLLMLNVGLDIHYRKGVKPNLDNARRMM